MDQLLKKKLIALLLFVCCLFGGWLLLTASSTAEKKLKNFAQFDSLIVHTLNKFDFYRKQIEHYKTTVDSVFNRKTYIITTASTFPETKLHLALKYAFQPYNVSVPALVIFPDKDLRIHFSYKNTIMRTLLIDVEEADSTVSR